MGTRIQRRHRTDIRRDEIANAAGAVMIRRGSEHITIREIAKEIRLSEGAIYRHFRNKRDILSLMVEHAEESMSNDIEKSLSLGGTPMQVLERALQNHISGAKQRQGASFQVIAEVVSLGDRKLNRQASAALERYTRRIRDLVAAGINAGEVKEESDPQVAALLITSMIQGLVNSWSLRNYEFDLEERYRHLWGILRRTLARENAERLGAIRPECHKAAPGYQGKTIS
ncbi:MAG: TetR/AcrR family transcriptional regulator [Dehalococcoidia bacterium]|nr:TetR/AcrR family transcriptional regulator [Dehalococcoidia bacterium]